MNFFLDRIAIVDLASASVVFQPLPEPALQNRDLACLGEIFADSLVFAAGRLTGSLAPASCLLTARCGDKTCLLKGHFGPALRRCGLDALVLCGKATRPSGLALTEQGIRLLDAESGTDAPTQRAALGLTMTSCAWSPGLRPLRTAHLPPWFGIMVWPRAAPWRRTGWPNTISWDSACTARAPIFRPCP